VPGQIEADIACILEQEQRLVFKGFAEVDAWSIGSRMRQLAQERGRGVLIDIRLWDRVLFTHAMAGTNADNEDWVRRKINVVRRFQMSSYRKKLEMDRDGKVFDTARGTDPVDYAAAGGGFPVRLVGGPVIGCVTVSNLPQRDDHGLVVEALSAHLGINAPQLA
jgi:uncharacterized protein (UPF0303 family)